MSRVIWTAEIGSCHQGDKSLAYELIRQAKWAGATIAKFQLGWTKEAQAKYCSGYDERRYVDDWAEDLAKWCADLDIEFMASIWSMEGLEVARKVGMERYKIAHQLNDQELIDAIIGDDKEVFWSSQAAGLFVQNCSWVICDEDYPNYRFRYDNRAFGYSSHMHGIADALVSVARGANFVEKHMTLYKYSGFPKDASFALVPSEFKQLVEIGEEIALLR